MKMLPKQRAYLELHFSIFLFGFTAILGALISVHSIALTWWRVGLTTISLLLIVNVSSLFKQLKRREILTYCGIGALIALHWITFFGAIKLSNASITLVCMASGTFFTSLFEPFILKTRIKKIELLLGLAIIPGMILVANNTDFDMMLGIGVGLISALLLALFASLNKKHIKAGMAYPITLIEMGSAFLFITLMSPFIIPFTGIESWIPDLKDFILLCILAFICTTVAFYLSLKSLNHLSAFVSMLSINLEPIYGMLLAIFILQEHKDLNIGFYFGALIIILAIFIHPFFNRKANTRK